MYIYKQQYILVLQDDPNLDFIQVHNMPIYYRAVLPVL